MIDQSPEFADGAYWVCEPVAEAVVNGEESPVIPPALKTAKAITWFINYEGQYYALHRTLTPVLIFTDLPHSTLLGVLNAAGKRPKGRVNGK